MINQGYISQSKASNCNSVMLLTSTPKSVTDPMRPVLMKIECNFNLTEEKICQTKVSSACNFFLSKNALDRNVFHQVDVRSIDKEQEIDNF